MEVDVVRSRRQASHEIEQSRVGHVPLAGEEQIGAQYGGYRAHTNGFPFPPCRPFFSLFASPITNVLVVRPVLLVCFHRFFFISRSSPPKSTCPSRCRCVLDSSFSIFFFASCGLFVGTLKTRPRSRFEWPDSIRLLFLFFFLLPFSLVVGVSDKFLLRHSETRTTKAISCYWCFLHRILNRCRAGSRSLNLGWPHSVGELTFTVPNFCIRWSICLGPLKFWTLTWPFLRLYVLSNIFLKNRFKPYLGSVFYSRSIVILRFGICEFFSNIDTQWVSHGIPKSFLYWNFFWTDVWPPSILILLCWFVYQLTVALGSESAWFLCDTRRVERELFVGGAVCFCPSFQRDWSPGSCENGRGYSECSLWSGSPAARTSSLSLSLFFFSSSCSTTPASSLAGRYRNSMVTDLGNHRPTPVLPGSALLERNKSTTSRDYRLRSSRSRSDVKMTAVDSRNGSQLNGKWTVVHCSK